MAKSKKRRKKPSRRKAAEHVLPELNLLGKKIEKALTHAAQSRELAGVKSEVSKSMRSIGKRLSRAVESARRSEESRQIQRQFEKVLYTGKKQGSQAAQKMGDRLAAGMKTLSKEFSELSKKLKKRKKNGK